MSNILPSSVASNSSIVAQSTQTSAQRGTSNQAVQSAAGHAVLTGQAAVVTISSDSKLRAASHGEKREVDASFEKEAIKDEEKNKQKEEKQTTVNVSA